MSLLSLVLSMYSIKTFSTLTLREPNWTYLRLYYKLKLWSTLLWAVEFSCALIILNSSGYDLSNYTSACILTVVGVLLELYFTYCIYSCFILGVSGRLIMSPLPVSVQNLETQPNEEIHIAREFKEIIAYPEKAIPEKCEIIITADYTQKMNNND